MVRFVLSELDRAIGATISRVIHGHFWLGLLAGHEQLGMLEFDRYYFIPGDNETHTQVCDGPQLPCKFMRGSDATVRSGITRQNALVKGHARPSDALHVRHRRAAIEVGMVIAVLLDHAEHTHRRRMTGHARRNRALRDAHSVTVERDFLRADIDGNLQRAFRHLAEAWIGLRLGPLLMAVRGHPDAAG